MVIIITIIIIDVEYVSLLRRKIVSLMYAHRTCILICVKPALAHHRVPSRINYYDIVL